MSWILAVLIVLGGVGGAVFFATRPAGDAASSLKPILGMPSEGEQVVALVAMTLHDAPDAKADSLTLFAIDRTGRKPVTVFVPTGTLVQIPSFTYGAIGDALERSDFLQQLAVENLLGVDVDRTFVLDDVTLGEMLDALGGIDVHVSEEIFITNDQGQKELAFPRGPQRMDAATAVLYMTERGGQSEIQRFQRQQKVWEAVFAAGESKVRRALGQVSPDSLTREDASSLAEVLAAMAARPEVDRFYEPIPVKPVLSGGDDETYTIADERAQLDPLVQRDFPASMLGGLPSARPRIEVRNAEGTPGGGEKAGALLIEGGMRVVLGQNAQRFGLAQTKIVIYSSDPPSMQLADRIRALLGRGRVEVSEEGQTVVQATVMIGRDFVDR